MKPLSYKRRREVLLDAIISFHGAGMERLYDILCFLSFGNTGNQGEIYALYRLSSWLEVRWMGHEAKGHDLEAWPEGVARFARLQVKTADPAKAWKNRWAFRKVQGGKKTPPYDFLLLLGKRPTDSEEIYREQEGDYAIFIVPYGMVNSTYFTTSGIDLYYNKSNLLQRNTTGNKFRMFYKDFETTFERAAEMIAAFCLHGEAASAGAMDAADPAAEAMHNV